MHFLLRAFDPDQPRDKSGRWSDGGGDSDGGKDDRLPFGQSRVALGGTVMRNALGAANLVDLKLGTPATNRRAMIWANGAGTPGIIVSTPAAMIEASTSIKIHAVRMPAVIFIPARDGDQFLAQFTMSCDLEALHELMRQADIGSYIVEEITTGTFHVHIIGSDQNAIDRIERITDGSRVAIIAGRF